MYVIPVVTAVAVGVAMAIAAAREQDRERVYYSAFEDRDTSSVGADPGCGLLAYITHNSLALHVEGCM
jgi:hypothetical protein